MPSIIGEKREGGINIRQGKNGILIREEPYHFTVQADSKWQDRLDILATPGLPTFGTVFVNGLSVKSMSAERDPGDSTRWHVIITCSTEVEDDQSSPTGSDPTTWIPIATLKYEPYDEALREDFSDPPKAIINSAGTPYEVGIVRTMRIPSVAFSQFEPISTTLDQIMERSDSINSEIYRGRAAHTLLLCIENAAIGTYGGFRCWRIDYQMKYKRDDWKTRIGDIGPKFISGGNLVEFHTEQWVAGTYDSTKTGETPFMGKLNLTGGAMTNQDTTDLNFNEFFANPQLDFNDFLKVLFTA